MNFSKIITTKPPRWPGMRSLEIGFDWLCFFDASNHLNLLKPLLLLIMRQFDLRQIGFVFSNVNSFLISSQNLDFGFELGLFSPSVQSLKIP